MVTKEMGYHTMAAHFGRLVFIVFRELSLENAPSGGYWAVRVAV